MLAEDACGSAITTVRSRLNSDSAVLLPLVVREAEQQVNRGQTQQGVSPRGTLHCVLRPMSSAPHELGNLCKAWNTYTFSFTVAHLTL